MPSAFFSMPSAEIASARSRDACFASGVTAGGGTLRRCPGRFGGESGVLRELAGPLAVRGPGLRPVRAAGFFAPLAPPPDSLLRAPSECDARMRGRSLAVVCARFAAGFFATGFFAAAFAAAVFVAAPSPSFFFVVKVPLESSDPLPGAS